MQRLFGAPTNAEDTFFGVEVSGQKHSYNEKTSCLLLQGMRSHLRALGEARRIIVMILSMARGMPISAKISSFDHPDDVVGLPRVCKAVVGPG